MVITRLSDFGFKITQGNYQIAVNPPKEKSDLETGRFSADLVLLSADHVGFDDAKHFARKKADTFVINGPGEYETGDLFIYGVGSTTQWGGSAGQNTIYYFNLDNMDVCVLGAHEPNTLPTEATEILDNVDILITPVVGDEVLSAVAAQKLATLLEAKVIILAGAIDPHDSNNQAFDKEASHESVVADKVSLRSTDLTEKPKTYLLEIEQ